MPESSAGKHLLRKSSDKAFLFYFWKSDFLSGFLVSLIALPLCLGIAGASGFPPVMGVLTAIVGGMIVSWFAGSELTIKGPAAGLIVIVAGCVEELGHGDAVRGWQLALGAIVIAGALQVLLGRLKVAVLADFFPLSAVHGMLTAIGIIILAKQIHFALGVDPQWVKGKNPIELLTMIPASLSGMNVNIALIGGLSVALMFGWMLVRNKWLKRVPPALLVVITGILGGLFFNLADPAYASLKPLVDPGEFSISFVADFSSFSGEDALIFWRYVLLFAIIGSLESMLTGKAIDLIDPQKRKSDLDKDLSAVGFGNMVSGMLGGLPMIAEVARSSANISNGGKTRMSNFFHGLFLLIFAVALVPVIKMIPVAALAAMLIFVGYRLASPATFFRAFKTGPEQFAVLVATVVVTLFTDLLLGIAVGIVVELMVNVFNGQKINQFFSQKTTVRKVGNVIVIQVHEACTFSNWIPFQKMLSRLPKGKQVLIDMSKTTLIGHTFMQNLLNYIDHYKQTEGARMEISGLDDMHAFSKEASATRRRKETKSIPNN